MPKYLSLVAMIVFAGSQAFGQDADNHYTVAQFSNDCQLSGGVPQIFENSANCEQVEGHNITCLRQANTVSACKLEGLSGDQISKPTPTLNGETK